MPPTCVNQCLSHKWAVMIMWQVCSLCICASGTICTVLTNRNGQTLPIFQLACTYTLLLIIHSFRAPKTSMPWIKYLVVSILNFGGDICAIYAYSLTSLSSAMLLATTVIFWVAPISYFFLKRPISWQQVLSIFVGMCGVVMVFIADGAGDSKVTGNFVALLTAVLYAVANILQEVLVYENTVSTYLFRFSLCTSPLSIVCSGAIEWKQIYEYRWDWITALLLIAYIIDLAFYYSIVPVIMQHSNATEMNISLLTSNFFSLGISILAFNQKASWLYLIGFICIPIAIVVFCVWGPKDPYENAGPQSPDIEENNPVYG